MASLGNLQESLPPRNSKSGNTFLQRYLEVGPLSEILSCPVHTEFNSQA